MADQITFNPTDPEILWILGRPCFVCGTIAHIFQAAGQLIPTRAEDEQAAVIIWMIQKYQQHGAADWKRKCDEELSGSREGVERKGSKTASRYRTLNGNAACYIPGEARREIASQSTLKAPPKPRITPEQRNTLKVYVQARRDASAANKIVEKHKAEVESIVRLLGGRAVEKNAVIFIGKSISYAYPAGIRSREQKLKDAKKIMQLDGRARKVSTDCLMFEDQAAKPQPPADSTK